MREFSLLNVLSRQIERGDHLHMKQVADAVVLSQSATTRLVTRLEERGLLSRALCDKDRRGIYTDVTPAGLKLLEAARPTNQTALHEALDEARRDAHLQPLVAALESCYVQGGTGRPGLSPSAPAPSGRDPGALQ
ncbi:MarR family winged helix-turn-helix transcriptional regulator [Silvibacterium dinghuense]|uniref:MarR family winged helix-turn-helix transcriptional regulator n=1 Tax=Silvibacterium dinghuense TaxID=1560006 RepID=UPI00199932AF|nr:MarR family transcriptional regulator [Silvibacterium dinghuense]GGG98827.1 hypothetical protein GCM10011586_12870 [Silvibacterium dinghuense]